MILDFGFWGRNERDDYCLKAAQLGVASKIHFLDVPADELRARLAARNARSQPGTFVIAEAKLEEWIARFQRQTADELDRRNVT